MSTEQQSKRGISGGEGKKGRHAGKKDSKGGTILSIYKPAPLSAVVQTFSPS